MDTRSNNPPAGAKPWSSLTAQARQAGPPADLDVRHLVRSALEAERRSPRARSVNPGVLDEIAALGQSWAVRFALGGCAVLAAIALRNGLDAVTGLGVAMDLQSFCSLL